MILERGALLNNRYRIVEILGQGGMGSVYRAVDENLGMEVAVKDNLFTTEEYARQFRREAVILASLRHPNLPRVTDHFVIEGQGQYLVMDYIEGEDLRQRMDRVGLISDEEVVYIGAAICDALTYLSSRNPSIVHRDIKPGNVKITPQGQIFLVDFGLAKEVQGSQATTTGARAMTPGYSPPEQYGTARTDQRSDVFSLGATLYAALTGGIPEDALARAMEQVELTPIRKLNPHVSRRLANVIEKSLSVKPDNRFQDAEEFKQALLNATGGTRRKTGEYVVSPPPAVDSHQISANENLSPVPFHEFGGNSVPINSSTLFPVSTPFEEPISRKTSGRSRRRFSLGGCLLAAVLVLFLFLGGVGAAYLYDPNLPLQALAWLWPASKNIDLGIPLALGPTTTRTPTQMSTDEPTLTSIPTTLPVVLPSPTAIQASSTPTHRPTKTAIPTATFTPLPTPYGGGSGQIAFAGEDITGTVQINVINVDGSGLRQITNISDGACQPDWSPDGERLVFISPCDSNHETYPVAALFIINADGTGLVPLPTMPGGDYDPAWSPDGKQIAFTSIRITGRPRIYVYNLDDNSVDLLSDEYSRDMQPAWSPDGKQIAFVTTRKGPSQIWLMDADGSNQHLFSHSKDMIDSNPTWSPDGQSIMFTQLVTVGGFPRLVAASIQEEGMREYVLNSGPVPMREGRYSPDGFWIAYESWPKGSNHDIYIMTANGSGKSRVTSGNGTEFDPAWRPSP
jgi:serine/threonine protein kinase/Tol biopolymer transport system component